MAYLIIRHRVENYSKWKPKYDAHGLMRKQAGCKNERIFRTAEDPNTLLILFEWDSVENARKFSQSPELVEVMRAAGVIGSPEFQFLDLLESKVTGQETLQAA